MPLGLCRRDSVANASERLHHLSEDKLFNDQGIVHREVYTAHRFMQKESAG